MTETKVHPQRLYLLQLGTSSVPLPNGGTLDMVLPAYLITLSDGRHVLIDTGLPAGHVPPSGDEKSVIEHLAALGLRPNDIAILICTHFDVDHAGYHDHFPQADLIVQREHYELAKNGHPRFAAAREHWDNPALHYRLIDGDDELLPGLTLLKTSGHAPAHQSVLVKLPQTGAVLLAIDAVMMERLFTMERKAWPMDDNEAELLASTRKLLDVVAREPVALTIFGHDAIYWRALKKSPEYYE